MPRRFPLGLFAAAIAIVLSFAARAQYPDRPITLVVPFAAGGATDTLARQFAERMARNARRATRYFRIPPNRVIEMGAEIEL